jgi:hypothetical protein
MKSTPRARAHAFRNLNKVRSKGQSHKTAQKAQREMLQLRENPNVPMTFGVRRQGAAATALWIPNPFRHERSKPASRPPHSKI